MYSFKQGCGPRAGGRAWNGKKFLGSGAGAGAGVTYFIKVELELHIFKRLKLEAIF